MADEGIVSRAGMIQELVMVSDGLLCMSTDDFTHNDVLALIAIGDLSVRPPNNNRPSTLSLIPVIYNMSGPK